MAKYVKKTPVVEPDPDTDPLLDELATLERESISEDEGKKALNAEAPGHPTPQPTPSGLAPGAASAPDGQIRADAYLSWADDMPAAPVGRFRVTKGGMFIGEGNLPYSLPLNAVVSDSTHDLVAIRAAGLTLEQIAE